MNEIIKLSDLTNEQIKELARLLDFYGGTVDQVAKEIGIELCLSSAEHIDLLFRVFNNPGRLVSIVYDDYCEHGDIEGYAIEILDSNGYWLNRFETEEQAMKFCKDFNLKVVEG